MSEKDSVDVVKKGIRFQCTRKGVFIYSGSEGEPMDELEFTWEEWNELFTDVKKVKDLMLPKDEGE